MKILMLKQLISMRQLVMLLCIVALVTGNAQAQDQVENQVQNNLDTSLFGMSLDELINMVTVRKKSEKSIDVPVSLTSYPEQTLQDYNIRSFNDYASKTPNLSFAYGNALTSGNPSTGLSSARSVAIRGIASARATGFYIDDIPLQGSMDVRALDLHNIEISKGPQGTLFGEGSLGGNIRLITHAPNLSHDSVRYQLETGQTLNADRINLGVEAVTNRVLAEDKAAMRLSLYSDDYAGYIKRTYWSDISNASSVRVNGGNQGGQDNIGGSIAGLVRATSEFDISARLLFQNRHYSGFPATWATLPAFEPQDTMERRANIQSDMTDRWTLPSLSLLYRGSGWTLNSTTSLLERNTRDLEDSTEGTLQITTGMPAQASPWVSTFKNNQFSHETRISFEPVNKLSGVAGIFYSKTDTDYEIPAVYATGVTPTLLWKQRDLNTQQNAALFGELYYQFGERWILTLGDRMYWLQQSDMQTVSYGDTSIPGIVDVVSSGDGASSGHSPKLGATYQWSDTAMLYGSATNGYRQGNIQLNPASFSGCATSAAALGTTSSTLKIVKPDSIWNYEAGGKFVWPDPGLELSTAVFHIDWQNPQQQMLLTSCGLFIQGNAGAATVDGAEMELSGQLTQALKLRLGLGYEDTRITESGNTGQAVGSMIYNTPQWTATMGVVYSKRLNDTLKGMIAADYSYTGDSISSNNGPYSLTRAAYSLVNVRTGVSWHKSTLMLDIKNLTDAKPNLGDITYIGYGLFTSAARTTPIPQVATLPPRTIMLQYSERF